LKKQKGFSLVDLVVLIVLLCVVAFVFMLMYNESSARSEAIKTLVAIQGTERNIQEKYQYYVDNPYLLEVFPKKPACKYEFKKISDSTFTVTASSKKFVGYYQIKETGEPQYFDK